MEQRSELEYKLQNECEEVFESGLVSDQFSILSQIRCISHLQCHGPDFYLLLNKIWVALKFPFDGTTLLFEI